MPLNTAYDVAIVGSGFAGSLLAMIARRLGHSVILLERGTHPRVVIGESSTPLSNLLLEELAATYDLPVLAPLTKWGSWQRSYPGIGCGLKRGFTFHHHVLGHAAPPDPDRRDQLLVAASPHDGIADTHWYRADFDEFFVQQARELGAEYVDELRLDRMVPQAGEQILEGRRSGRDLRIRARLVVDASGPRGFLHRALGLGECELPALPATQSIYSHFSGVSRLEGPCASRTEEQPPYPIDDAAVHHVFDGGWIWVLRFNNGITSASVVCTDEIAQDLRIAEGAPGWERLLRLIHALEEQFAEARAERSFTYMPRVSFCSRRIVGENWALLPSAAGFVDPLLSTGFPLTLLGVARLAAILREEWGSADMPARLEDYQDQTQAELMATSRLVGALYANTSNFPVFVSLTLLYFAAASFSETVRRLGRPELAPSFLLHDHPHFGPVMARLLERSLHLHTEEESAGFVQETLRAIEPINVAGLGDPGRRNWYPVEAEDLLAAAGKVGASREEILQLLRRCGFSSH
ncbi:MAG TPA: tryptophan 7-halogenase [Acidobacteriaceae bacterium]|nr:tryptophan 7-halogenase [Acidobacteriaceae bacterium]